MEKLQIIKGNVEIRANEPDTTAPDEPQTPPKDDKATTTDKLKLGGYAIIFSEPSEVMTTNDGTKFTETVSAEALQGVDLSNLVLLSDHDYKQPLASVDAGTLTADVDEKGLSFEAQLDPSVSYANDVYQNVKNGNISKMSFGFQIADNGDSWKQDDGTYSRTITKIEKLYELSVCVLPAYSDTEVSTRSLEKFITLNEKDNKTMKKDIIKPENKENTEIRSFEKYVASHGRETRDLATDTAGVAIPEELVTPAWQSKVGSNDLSAYLDSKNVSVGAGNYPVFNAGDPSAVLASKDENAEIGSADIPMKSVAFQTKTYAGKLLMSDELIQDNSYDIAGEVKQGLAKLVTNTNNAEILKLLKALPAKVAKTVDDLKAAKNSLDFGLTPIVITNQDGFNYLDCLKDSEGRYLLTPDVSAESGKSLFGFPVVVMNNKVLPNVKAGQYPVFIGDLAEYAVIFKRAQVLAQWEQFSNYANGISIIARMAFVEKNADAVVALTLDTTQG